MRLLNFPDLFYFWKMCTIWLHWKTLNEYCLLDFTHGPCIRDSTDAWTQAVRGVSLVELSQVLTFHPMNWLTVLERVEFQGCPCPNPRNGWICYLYIETVKMLLIIPRWGYSLVYSSGMNVINIFLVSEKGRWRIREGNMVTEGEVRVMGLLALRKERKPKNMSSL